ncbi:MAG: glycosyltransferase family 4 protein [Gemmatimonadota bacterium]
MTGAVKPAPGVHPARAPRSVLFLVPIGPYGPSGVLRALDYVPLLEADGISTTVVSYDSPTIHRLRHLETGWSRWIPGKFFGLLNRLHRAWALRTVLRRAASHDVVFIQWVHPPAAWTRELASRNPRIVFDLDDPVFLRDPEAAEALARTARVVSAGSRFNLEWAQKQTDRAVYLHTQVPVHLFPQTSAPSGPWVEIAWVGSPSTMPYLELLREPLAQVAQRFPGRIRWTVVGTREASHEIPALFPGMEIRVIPWVGAQELRDLLRTFHIGVTPLKEGIWEQGKSPGKTLQYMAAGLPSISSPVGEYVHVLKHGEEGFYASTSQEWVEHLSRLVEDEELRTRMGRAARRRVEAEYSTEVCYARLRSEVLGGAMRE